MFGIDKYIKDLTAELKSAFGKRLLYVGLQGSYLRGETTEKSDIDIMAVIDGLSVGDLNTYRKALITVGNFDKSCGFICGKSDLENWNPLEICHLLNSTKDCFGELKSLVPAYSEEDERNYVRLSVNNLYHELCHRFVQADREYNISRLPASSKQVFYILQHLNYLRTGNFIQAKHDLLKALKGDDKKVLQMCINMQNGVYDFDKAFETLFNWCQRVLGEV